MLLWTNPEFLLVPNGHWCLNYENESCRMHEAAYKNIIFMECALTDWLSQPHKIHACYSQRGERRKYGSPFNVFLPPSPSERLPCHSLMTSLKPAWKGLPWQVAVERPVTARLALKNSRSSSPMGKIFLSLTHTHTHTHLSGSLNWCLANLGQLKRLNSIYFSLSLSLVSPLSSLPADHQ